jgi:P pilus assembly chaperone PapD
LLPHRFVASRAALVAVVALGMIAASRPVRAQGVLVAPTVIFANSRTRSATMDLINTSAGPSEITVETQFGYPVTDSAGGISVKLVDTADTGAPSIAKYIVAYPRKVRVPAGGKQTIRLLVNPPANLADGEYWSRIIITSAGGPTRLSARATNDTGAIQVGVTLIVRTVTTLLYRQGAVTAAVTASGLTAERRGDSIVVRVQIARAGTGVFLGMAHLELLDATGRAVALLERQLPVYYPLSPRYSLLAPKEASAPFSVRLTLANDRGDIPIRDRLPFPPVIQTAIVK